MCLCPLRIVHTYKVSPWYTTLSENMYVVRISARVFLWYTGMLNEYVLLILGCKPYLWQEPSQSYIRLTQRDHRNSLPSPRGWHTLCILACVSVWLAYAMFNQSPSNQTIPSQESCHLHSSVQSSRQAVHSHSYTFLLS